MLKGLISRAQRTFNETVQIDEEVKIRLKFTISFLFAFSLCAAVSGASMIALVKWIQLNP